MKERRRKHDDAHFPMGGKGKRATRPKGGTPSHSNFVTNNDFSRRVIGWDRDADSPIYEDEPPKG